MIKEDYRRCKGYLPSSNLSEESRTQCPYWATKNSDYCRLHGGKATRPKTRTECTSEIAHTCTCGKAANNLLTDEGIKEINRRLGG